MKSVDILIHVTVSVVAINLFTVLTQLSPGLVHPESTQEHSDLRPENPLAWLEGTWQLDYTDAQLGPVQGEAVLKLTVGGLPVAGNLVYRQANRRRHHNQTELQRMGHSLR